MYTGGRLCTREADCVHTCCVIVCSVCLLIVDRTLEQATPHQVLDAMRKWAQNMHPYNRLRAPTFPADGGAREQYLNKYEDAFTTCVFAGVPQMTTSIVGVTNQVYWILDSDSLDRDPSPNLSRDTSAHLHPSVLDS